MTDTATGALPRGRTERVRTMRMPRRLRNLEIALLVVVWAINAAAIVLVQLGATGAVQPNVIVLVAGLSLLTLMVHLVLRFTASEADPFVLPIATLLNGLGIAGIYRIDVANGDEGFTDSVAIRQIVWSAIAIVCALAVLIVIRNHRVLQRYTYLAMLVSVLLLLLPMLPGIGQTINGARVWISIGPFSFQPGEIAKIALAVFFAGYLVSRRESSPWSAARCSASSCPAARTSAQSSSSGRSR
ncbi:hypothetical protein GCM10025866_13070 [Naasia aerilata]|uniref:Cell division protein FtsW n=1 Tax=Naasia aerilata TaxID=1162966 RepID=A0ABM8GB25_9MICO|nr:hypothetical protein GCM10025866_13070 [Naasia aerilata]